MVILVNGARMTVARGRWMCVRGTRPSQRLDARSASSASAFVRWIAPAGCSGGE